MNSDFQNSRIIIPILVAYLISLTLLVFCYYLYPLIRVSHQVIIVPRKGVQTFQPLGSANRLAGLVSHDIISAFKNSLADSEKRPEIESIKVKRLPIVKVSYQASSYQKIENYRQFAENYQMIDDFKDYYRLEQFEEFDESRTFFRPFVIILASFTFLISLIVLVYFQNKLIEND